GPEPSAGGGECSVARTGVKMRGLAGRGLQSLSFQLALAMALMALAAAGVSVSLLFSDSSGELLAQAQEALLIEQHLHAQTLAQEVAEKLDAVSHLNSRLTQRIGAASVDDVTTYVYALYSDMMSNREYVEVRIANPDGAAQVISRGRTFGEASLAGSPTFWVALAGHPALGRFERYELDEETLWTLEVALPARDPEGTIVGVISVLVSAERFPERLANFSLAHEGANLLVRADGTVLLGAGWDDAEPRPLWDEETPAELQRQYQELLAATEATSRLVETQEETYLMTVVPIDGTDWRLLTQIPQRILTDRLLPLRNAAIRNTLLGVVVVSVLAFILGRVQARGVVEVTRAMQHFVVGDLTYRVQERGRNEVGELARSFNTAAGRLSRLIADVAAAASEVQTASQELA